jgi:hypothetical protein
MSDYTLMPAIYVVCTEAFQQGIAYGRWLDASLSLKVLKRTIREMLRHSPSQASKRWHIQQFRDFGDCLKPSDTLHSLQQKAVLIQIYGSLAIVVLHYFEDLKLVQKQFDTHYRGAYASPAHFIGECLKEAGGVEGGASVEALFKACYRSFRVDGVTHVFSKY